jgi:hypothetical protein
MKPMHKLIRIVRIENIKRKACPKWPRSRPMQLTQNVTIGKTETYQHYQTSKLIEIFDKNINHTKNASRYQNIKSQRNTPHALTSKVFPEPRQALHTTTPPRMRSGRPTRCYPGDGTRNILCQKPTTPHTAIASHTIAACVSPIVVSSITGAVVLLYLYRDRLHPLTSRLC